MIRWVNTYREAFAGLPRSIWSLALVLLINRTGAMVLPFLSVYLTKEMGITLAEAAEVLPYYGLGSMAGAYIGGQLTNRIGAYATQVVSLLLSGVALFILKEMDDITSFCAALFATSMMMDIFRPANMASIGEYAPKALRTKAVGLIRLAVNVGYSLGPVVAGFIAGFLSYDWLFIIDGVTCWIAAAVFVLSLSRPSEVVTMEEKTEQSTGRIPYLDPRFMSFIGLTLITGIVFIQLIYTIPVYYEQEVGLSEHQIGPMLALNALVVALFEMPIIHSVQDRVRPVKLLYIGALLMGLSYLIYAATTAIVPLVMAVLIFSIGELLNLPFAASVALDISPERRRGTYMGLFTMVWSVCTLVGPWLGFKLTAWMGFTGMWTVMAAMAGLATLGYLVFERRYRIGSASRQEVSD